MSETNRQLLERLANLRGRTWEWKRWESRPAERAPLGDDRPGTILAQLGDMPSEITGERVPDIWDHDHCEVCWARFTTLEVPDEDPLTEGYTTPGPAGLPDSEWRPDYHWVCAPCFAAHRELFGWTA